MPNWLKVLLRDEVAKKIIWLGFAVTVAGALILLKYARKNMPTSTLVLGIALLAIIGSLSVIAFVRRRSYRSAWYPTVRFHYETFSKRISYRIEHDGALHYSRKFLVKAMQDNLDGYTDRFVWTGGESDAPVAGAGVASIETRLVAGIWTFFHVNFDRTLRKGEEHEFEIIWPSLHNWQKSSPFVSASTEEPTRSLSFDVLIPEGNLASSAALTEELRGIEAIYPFRTQNVKFDNNRLTWSPRPKLYRHYRLRWSWAGDSAVRDIASVDPSHKGQTS